MTSNPKLNKLICALIVLALLAATVYGAVIGLTGRDTEVISVQVDGEWEDRALYRQVSFIPNTFNDTWHDAYTPSVALGGGYAYTLTAQRGEGVSDADYEKQVKRTAAVLRERAELMAGSAQVRTDGGDITVTVAQDAYNEELARTLATTGYFTFCLPDAESGALLDPFMTSDNITNAGSYPDSGTYYLSMFFDKAGAKALADATTAHVGSNLYILMDGQTIANPYISEPLTNSGTAISMESVEMARHYAVLMRAGALESAVSLTTHEAAGATAGQLLNIVVIVMGVVVLLSAAWFIVRARLLGAISAWALIAQVVLLSLFAAIIALTGGMVLTVFNMAVLILCELIAIFGIEVLQRGILTALGKGRGVRASVNDAFGKKFKLLGIVNGALAGIGLLLMFIFQGAQFGLLGRVMAISGIIDLAILYIFMRTVISCCYTLAGENTRLYGAKR